MEFASIVFLSFFGGIFILYWFVFSNSTKTQNAFLLCTSLFFYSFLDLRFLFLLIGSTLLFYYLGILINSSKEDAKKESVLWVGCIAGIGLLMYFKYVKFFLESFNQFLNAFNISCSPDVLQIAAPLGISFYTFRLLSYLIDVYREDCKVCTDWILFANYVSFFPCIISGPIDRPSFFITQLEHKRVFDYSLAVDGCRQILWGIFKKWVIADNCVWLVNNYFENTCVQTGSSLLFGAMLCLVQIYADFSGYSDMAIGISKLLGIRVTINFHYPLFASSIAEFWRCWHISLTSWMTDYVFIPLAFIWRRYKKWGKGLAIIINFILIGLWHGPRWTYILYGLLNGLLFIPIVFKRSAGEYKKFLFLRRIATFLTVSLLVIFFRANTLQDAIMYFKYMITPSLFSFPVIQNKTLICFILFLFMMEWKNRHQEHALNICFIHSKVLRFMIYFILIMVCYFFRGEVAEFIYQRY